MWCCAALERSWDIATGAVARSELHGHGSEIGSVSPKRFRGTTWTYSREVPVVLRMFTIFDMSALSSAEADKLASNETRFTNDPTVQQESTHRSNR